MSNPIMLENFADNGEYSHQSLIDSETGNLLWSEAPEEEIQQVKPCNKSQIIQRLCCLLGFHKNYEYHPYPNVYQQCKVDRCECCGHFEWR